MQDAHLALASCPTLNIFCLLVSSLMRVQIQTALIDNDK